MWESATGQPTGLIHFQSAGGVVRLLRGPEPEATVTITRSAFIKACEAGRQEANTGPTPITYYADLAANQLFGRPK